VDIPKFDTYWHYVEYWSDVDPDFPSLRDEHRTVTAKEFQDKTEQLAKAFLHLGLKKGDRVATILPQSIDYILVMVAANKVGAILVPLDVKFRGADLKRFISHAEPKIMVSLSGYQDFDIVKTFESFGSEFDDMDIIWAGASEHGTSLDQLLAMPLDLDEELKRAKNDQNVDDPMLIIFTGGTTGIPKAALLSHRNTTHMTYTELEHILIANGVSFRSPHPVFLPPSHIGGTSEIIGMGIVGGLEMIMMESWSPVAHLELTQREKMEWIGGVPTMLAIILSLPNLASYDLSSVKVCFLSGEKVSHELWAAAKEKICGTIITGYGSTEAGAETNITTGDDPIEKIAKGYVGKAVPGVRIKICDDDENELPTGETGEVTITGPYSIQSYFRMPEEDMAGFTSDGWVKTGDLGYLTEDGGLYIQGRKKHIIRVGSYTVLPTEIEEVVIQLPEVSIAAAIGLPDEIYGEEIWLYVVPEPGQAIDKAKIIELCQKELAKFKVPKKVFVQESIPLTRIGKADRRTLKEQVLRHAAKSQ
jgi:acyl-CoA synthetase (AMP-forming)/AMP-acid ligase II